MVNQKPDIYLDELQELLTERSGVHVHESTIWRALTRSGFTMKKVWIKCILNATTHIFHQLTREAIERSEDQRTSYRYSYGATCRPEATVFVDESSFDRRAAIRDKAWALKGKRAVRQCFFIRGKRYVYSRSVIE